MIYLRVVKVQKYYQGEIKTKLLPVTLNLENGYTEKEVNNNEIWDDLAQEVVEEWANIDPSGQAYGYALNCYFTISELEIEKCISEEKRNTEARIKHLQDYLKEIEQWDHTKK